MHQPLPLALRLILIVSRVAQYVVYGGPWFKRELRASCYSFNFKDGLSSAGRLPNISPEMVGPD